MELKAIEERNPVRSEQNEMEEEEEGDRFGFKDRARNWRIQVFVFFFCLNQINKASSFCEVPQRSLKKVVLCSEKNNNRVWIKRKHFLKIKKT